MPRTRTNKRTNKRMRGGTKIDSMSPNARLAGYSGSVPRGVVPGDGPMTGFGPSSYDTSVGYAGNLPLLGPGSGGLFDTNTAGNDYYDTKLTRGGRRHRKRLSRKSNKKVKRCVKKANAKKSYKAKRSATKKCMKLKKRLSKH